MSKETNIYPFSLDFKNNNGKPFFAAFPFIANGNPITEIICGISSVYAGDMKFDSENKNRQTLFTELGLNPVNVYGLKQIHCRSVLIVSGEKPPLAEADGMVTQDRGIVLSVTVADCLPIYLYDTKSGAFGIVHSGWKGTGIVINAVNLMKKNWGADACDIAAVLGPCIDSCCYMVDQQRAVAFKKEFGSESVREFSLYNNSVVLADLYGFSSVIPGNAYETGKDYYLDLKTANINLLIEAGVKNIAVCEDCTFTDERLGSFRREGEKFIRMAALVGTIPLSFS